MSLSSVFAREDMGFMAAGIGEECEGNKENGAQKNFTFFVSSRASSPRATKQ